MNTRHLDLGCGLKPRNPYVSAALHGVDIRDIDLQVNDLGYIYKKANLITEKIPYPNDYFDSVSAFDFLEHVPRQIYVNNGTVRNAFVELMNEIHRVLTPGGRFLALTPAYPHPSVFSDPTHVNFITKETCSYFVGPDAGGNMYGFNGHFEVIKMHWDVPANTYSMSIPIWRKHIRRFHRRFFAGGLSHLVWELRCVK